MIAKADYANMSTQQQDDYDLDQLYDILQKQILPVYYEQKDTWRQIIKNGMRDVQVKFDSGRMADEYYVKMYS